MFSHQVNQWHQLIRQADEPVGEGRAGDATPITREDLFQSVQRQCIQVFGNDDIRQRIDARYGLAQWM